MPVGYRNSAGVDFEQLFEPDLIGDGPTAPFLRTAAGVPLRFAARGSAPKGPDVGYRDSAGVDVSNLWRPAGSTPPITDGGLPTFLYLSVVAPPGSPGSARVQAQYARNGTASWVGTDPGSGAWATGANPGDQYQIRFLQVSGAPAAGSGATWQTISTTRTVSLEVSTPDGTPEFATSVVQLQIRRLSDSVVLIDRPLTLTVEILQG